MLTDLLYKELHLAVPWWMWLFLVFPVGLIAGVPAWPYYIAVAYLFMVPMIIAQNDKASNDLLYSVMLPVRKADIVKARMVTLILFEVAGVAAAGVGGLIHAAVYAEDNVASMNPNLAFLGTLWVMFAIFNAIYLPGAYKRAYRMAWPLLGGSVIAVVVAALLNTAPLVVPALDRAFNGRGLDNWGPQLAVFAAGLAIWALTWIPAWRKAAANFERVNL
jgi:hypothetical protein